MVEFEFSFDVISTILDEIKRANEFISIAIFQIHHEEIFEVLKQKLKQNIPVEIFTLPYNSIHKKIKDTIIPRFEEIINLGAKIHFCKWHVGDPGRTSTAAGVWYSFHGKFIVTDKSAIALSANLTSTNELDAVIIYRNKKSITLFQQKFLELIDLFVTKTTIDSTIFDGTIRKKIIAKASKDYPLSRYIGLPDGISEDYTNHWVKQYPVALCASVNSIADGLYITPFDFKARDLLEEILAEAKEFAYISAESFTDPDFPDILVKYRQTGLEIKILTGFTSMDFSDRIQVMFRKLLSHEIAVKTITEKLHAKLVITDKHLVVSSINLNKINLGFHQTLKMWRSNTETVLISSDSKLINIAKQKFKSQFEKSIPITRKLAEKLEKTLYKQFKVIYKLVLSGEVKRLLANFIVMREIEQKKLVNKVGQITAAVMRYFDKSKVEKKHFLFSLILYFLTERKHDFDQLNERLDELVVDSNLIVILNHLEMNDLIEKEGDYYKINILKLFGT